MKFLSDRDILSSAVTPASLAASTKNTLSVIENVLLRADSDTGEIAVTGYDLEKGINVTISGDGVTVRESGGILINALKLASILKTLAPGEVKFTTNEKFDVKIVSGRSEYNLRGEAPDKFPALPTLKISADSAAGQFQARRYCLKNGEFKKLIEGTAFAIAQNSTTPALSGALFNVFGGNLRVVAVDRLRFAVKKYKPGEDKIAENDENSSFIVPGKALGDILRIIGDGDDDVILETSPRHMVVSAGNVTIFSRLIEGEFVDWKRMLSVTPKMTVEINRAEFLQCVERASVMTDDKTKTLVRINFINDEDGSRMEITSKSSMGEVADSCEANVIGDAMGTVGFNHRHLLDTLRVIKEEKVLLILESPIKQVIIRKLPEGDINAPLDIDAEEFIYLVLPVRLHD
ncbi:DNA polymerase III subunit beta [Clostridia bacterium]|nr:DNA polymerase III subunit beta [Clostridia bacterium]